MPVSSRLRATGLIFGILLASVGAAYAGLGQPTPWQLGLQQSVTPVMDNIIQLHDFVLYIIAAITAFVLLLLLIIVVR
ncbi:MAG TPA: cytochrome c oxidase subunit II transmembrane domain-containing protein, partial [Xanthobacteraceae bacterium]